MRNLASLARFLFAARLVARSTCLASSTFSDGLATLAFFLGLGSGFSSMSVLIGAASSSRSFLIRFCRVRSFSIADLAFGFALAFGAGAGLSSSSLLGLTSGSPS